MNQPIDYITDKLDCPLLKTWATPANQATKQGHNYIPLYHRHFQDITTQVRKVLEIGVQTERSVNLWKDYFPHAEIHGIDIDPACKQYENERIKIHIGSQADTNFLSTLPKDFDIIIDDGSHIPDHQIASFLHLYQHHMKDRGIYVVEDCQKCEKTVDFFASLTSLINYWPDSVNTSDWPKLNSLKDFSDEYFLHNILGIAFYRFIVFIDKGRNPEEGEAAHRINFPAQS